jgi:hypothetical protein
MAANCPSCGAPAKGRLCEYCGRLLVVVTKVEEEFELVNLFHDLVMARDKRGQQLMLRNGFLPQSDTALVEAGLRCLPLIDADQINPEPTRSAYLRLKGIVAKLRVRNSAAARQALPELEKAVETYRRDDAKAVVQGLLLILGLVLLAVGVGWLVWRFRG